MAKPVATLYRMVLPDHTCPYGVKAKALLEQAGYAVDDQVLDSRAAVDAFKAERGVGTTPQIIIADRCIGGCDALEQYLSEA